MWKKNTYETETKRRYEVWPVYKSSWIRLETLCYCLFVVVQHLWARLLLPTIMSKVKQNFFAPPRTFTNAHQSEKKRFWRAVQHLPFQDPKAIFPETSSLAILPFSTNFQEKDVLFVLLISNFDFTKFQPPSPVLFTQSLHPQTPWPHREQTTCILFRCCAKAASARSSVRARFCTSQPGTEAHTSSTGRWDPSAVIHPKNAGILNLIFPAISGMGFPLHKVLQPIL